MKALAITIVLILALNWLGTELLSHGYSSWAMLCAFFMYLTVGLPIYWKVTGWWVKRNV